MYHEEHGEGTPLVLLHGGLSTLAVDFGQMIPALSELRRVIGVEQQAHGHTPDADRPLSYAGMAADTIATLRSLGIEQADFFGFSMGGAIALEIALQEPALVRKVVAAGGTCFAPEGLYPEVLEGIGVVQPEMLYGTPYHQGYLDVAPNPDDFPALVEKIGELNRTFTGWTASDIESIQAPMMLMAGDSDIVRLEHVVEYFRLLGGGVIGDLHGIPRSWLAILRGTGHASLMARAGWIVPMVISFLEAE
jgi:pimeloyl-ACP methyl ester carboxylesterase